MHDFGGPSHVVGFSRGTIDNGRTIIDEGPLRGHVDRIKKIDRHKRIAYLDIGLLDQKQVRVGLEIVRKPDLALRSLNQLAARSSTDRRRRRNPSFDLPAGNCMRLYGRDRTYFDARKRCRVCVSPASKG